MTDFIINPMWIYLVDLFSNLKGLLELLLILGSVSFVMCAIGYVIWRADVGAFVYDEEIEKGKKFKRAFKIGAIVLSATSLLYTVVPSEKTMYAMMAATYVTPENIELTGEAITEIVDYVFEKAGELGEEK